ncbi:MAG: hypothetical protein KAH38_11650, partial [Candidatus Hydrogenedentes bacterium]|nr:hypothetical protein [Candidatus Hydrogenedentota bacterium]
MKYKVVTAITAALLCFAGAAGAQIPITTIGQLQQIGTSAEYPIDGNFVLIQDIDASGTAAWNGGAGFEPLGTTQSANYFTGTLDGAGYTIYDLVLNRGGENHVAIFKVIGGAGTIKDIRFTGAQITGGERTGIIAGSNYGGRLENISVDTGCHITGNKYTGSVVGYNTSFNVINCDITHSSVLVEGSGTNGYVGGIAGSNQSDGRIIDSDVVGQLTGTSSHTGGIAGENHGQIHNSTVSGTVSGTETVGGIAGENHGQIHNSTVSGTVSGTNSVGGIMGYTDGGTVNACVCTAAATVSGGYSAGGIAGTIVNGSIISCLAEGTVSGGDRIGGLIGNVTGGITELSLARGTTTGTSYGAGGFAGEISGGELLQCYAAGAVNGSNRVGGLAGYQTGGTITECYALGQVTGARDFGGLVGARRGSSTVTRSYWVINTTGIQNSAGGIGLYDYQARQSSFYTDWEFIFAWDIIEGCTYPFFRDLVPGGEGEPEEGECEPVEGEGEPGIIEISSIEQLQEMGWNPQYPMSGHYVLINDIDASATAGWNDGKGFNPLGTADRGINEFTGILDGAGYTISGLTINRSNDYRIALFKSTWEATVKNINFTNANITGWRYVGVIADRVSGLVDNITFDGVVIHTSDRGAGVVACSNSGTVQNIDIA